MSPCRLFELTLVTVLCAATGTASHAAPAPKAAADPLARPEFDNELTFELRRVDSTELFRKLARAADVPFVLDFERDPDLMGSFNVKNMSVRAILASLAGNNGFEYASSEQGIIVRRVGMPRAAEPYVVGGRPGPQYEMQFLVYKVAGNEKKVLSSPRVTTQLKQVAEVKQGIAVKTPQGAGSKSMLQMKIRPLRETSDGVELEMEFISTRSLSETRYIDDHSSAKMIVGKEETPLFRSEDGYEITLKEWRAIDPVKKASGAAAGEAPIYDLSFVMRDPGGQVLSTPQAATGLNQALDVTQGVQSNGRDRMLKLKVVPTKDVGTGLELSLELADRLYRARGRYVEEHVAETRTVGADETTLFRTDDGYEIVLQRWSKR